MGELVCQAQANAPQKDAANSIAVFWIGACRRVVPGRGPGLSLARTGG